MHRMGLDSACKQYAKQPHHRQSCASFRRPSIIRDNRIEHLIKAPYATNDRGFYIYFDEATDGFTVENNYCPDAEFGYNRPGPAMIIRNNGPHVKLN